MLIRTCENHSTHTAGVPEPGLNRRKFLKTTAVAVGTLMLDRNGVTGASPDEPRSMVPSELPHGSAPPALNFPHFPSRLHAYIWRNWHLVPPERLAKVVGAQLSDILRIGKSMGLPLPPRVTTDQQRRSHLTIIKRNWHLLPYEQMLELLGWTPEQMAYTLREDDFFFVKLGSLKPRCEPLKYRPPDETELAREREIGRILRQGFGGDAGLTQDALFGFVSRLSQPPIDSSVTRRAARFALSPRFCYSYFALYGDPLLQKDVDPYPDGYLARMAASGVDGIWLPTVLHKLAPFPWDKEMSARYEERLRNLRALADRARRHGIGVFLYLNEPRALPLSFYKTRPELMGVVEGEHGTLCTSQPEVQTWLAESVASICRAAPGLAGFFTITASENLTNCWSHGGGAKCRRCGKRSPAEVIAELNGLFNAGIQLAHSSAQLIVWDWGWADDWAEEIIKQLPKGVALMSVSEWSMPIQRGGVESVTWEYSISTIGPGPRAKRHWELARRRGLKTIAKIQAGNTWELSAVPYIPAVENVARHVVNLREAGVDGLMLGWTLGGYPSPNIEVVAELAKQPEPPKEASGNDKTPPASVEEAMATVAKRRFGVDLAPAFVKAWQEFSAAFSEFPFSGGLVYSAPLQLGPANLLWAEATGYHASMVGFPYDDLDAWRAAYPVEVFIGQFEKVADGFDRALADLKRAIQGPDVKPSLLERWAQGEEFNIAEASAIHFRSVANQARFLVARRGLGTVKTKEDRRLLLDTFDRILKDEMILARRLYAIQIRDSRIGFEASNQYYYVPLDLVEKVLSCRFLLDEWLPDQRNKREL